MIKTIGFIGLGLIGGSIAKALRRTHSDYSLIAFDENPQSLVKALADGILNATTDTVSGSFGDCDIIFLCTPVDSNVKYMKMLKSIIKDGCIITDVGSVKSEICRKAADLGIDDIFVGGHPMAGSEKSGYENSTDRLLENIYYILTPSGKTPDMIVDILREVVTSMGAIPVVLKPEIHDKITAIISHLPHIIAYNLVNLVKDNETDDCLLRMLAAGGFKDITRIASSSPVMWQQICRENSEPIINILDEYIESLNGVRCAIHNNDSDYLMDSFTEAKNYRDDIPSPDQSKGIIAPFNEIFVDIIDESGSIATIATILAANNVSIKNIGIIHNREFQDGVLRIEFYDQLASNTAQKLLERFHYTIHIRN